MNTVLSFWKKQKYGWQVGAGILLIFATIAILWFFGKGNLSADILSRGPKPTFEKPPRGVVERLTPDKVEGWAYDPMNLSQPVQIRILLDGQNFITTTTSLLRTNLGPYNLPAGNFGFAAKFSTFPAGNHVVTVQAVAGTRTRLLTSIQLTGSGPGNEPPVVNPQIVRKTVDIWPYMVGRSGEELCHTAGGDICWNDAEVTPGKRVVLRSDGGMSVTVLNTLLGRIGVTKDGWASGPNSPWLRCFGQTGQDCAADYPPLTFPSRVELPVFSADKINANRGTLGATETALMKEFYVNPLDPLTCTLAGQTAGKLAHSARLFLLDHYDFGGDIGVQNDVLVEEEVGGYFSGATDPWKAVRMERYYFTKEHGHLREEGWEDPDCRLNPNATTCDGVYTDPLPGGSNWSFPKTENLTPFEYCGPNATGAKITQFQFPQNLHAGETGTVKLVVQNTGGATWTKADGYRLGSQAPQDNTLWGTQRIYLESNDRIVPGAEKTFSFPITAPSTPGTYTLSWRMLREGVEWFGDTASGSITVLAPAS